MAVTLTELDEDALVHVLTRPKNALTKQYQKFFELEDVQLEFTDEAIRSVAHIASKRRAGARGLRSVHRHGQLRSGTL